MVAIERSSRAALQPGVAAAPPLLSSRSAAEAKPGATMLEAVRSRPAALFVGLAYLFSWAVWVPMAVAHYAFGSDWPSIFGLVGALGPGPAALITAAVVGGRPEAGHVLGLFKRWRFAPVWYAAALLSAVVLLVAYAITLGVGATTLPADLGIASVLVMLVVQIPNTASEELGWRGWLQPQLQARTSALPAAVVVGLIWFAWHLPYWVSLPSFAQDGPGIIALNLLWMVPITVIAAWLANSANSVVPAWLMHLSTNVVSGLLPVTYGSAMFVSYPIVIVLSWVVAIVIVARFGAARLAPAPSPA